VCAYSRVILFAGGDTPCPPPLFCSIHPSRFVSRCLSCALFLTLSLPPSLCHTHTHTPACFVTSPAMTVSFGSERVSDMVRGKRESMNAFLVRERESARTHVRHMDPQNCEHSLTHGLSHTNVHTQIRARARARTHTHTPCYQRGARHLHPLRSCLAAWSPCCNVCTFGVHSCIFSVQSTASYDV